MNRFGVVFVVCGLCALFCLFVLRKDVPTQNLLCPRQLAYS